MAIKNCFRHRASGISGHVPAIATTFISTRIRQSPIPKPLSVCNERARDILRAAGGGAVTTPREFQISKLVESSSGYHLT